MAMADSKSTLIINPEKSCRLCLSQSLDMQNIASSLIVDGDIVSVVDMLVSLGITVNINNRLLPKKVCTDCKLKIISFYAFKKQTVKLEKSLISIFSPQTITEIEIIQDTDDDTRSTFDSANLTNEHSQHSQSELVEFYICNGEDDVEAKDIEINDLQVQNNTKSKKSEINDNDVSSEGHNMMIVNHIDGKEENQKLHSTQPLRRSAGHTSSHPKHSTRSKKPTTATKSTTTTTLRDYFANVDVNSDVDELNGFNEELADHNKSHHIMRLIIKYFNFFPCHNCCLLFISKDKLDEHNTEEHAGITQDQTGDYSYTFLDEFKVAKVYFCGECRKSFLTIAELKIHVLSHARKFECPMENCGSEYNGLGHLSNHVFKKHINMNHQTCFHCKQAFETYEDLQSHIRNYCTAKVFDCFECDKKFYSKKALDNHLEKITGKKFKCNTCEKVFKNKFQLQIHTRSHTNERPFKCTICDKSYKTSSMRTIHMDTHNSELTYECKICHKILRTRATYRSHVKRHTQEKKHKCEQCGKCFYTNHHLRLHQSKMHKENVAIQPKTQENDDYNFIMNDGDLAKFIDDDDIMQFLI